MAGYADELSLKLSAHDEMSAKLRAVKKELTSTGREMNAARKEFENTGAPEAAKEYKRLRDEYERLLTTQKELRTATKAASNELERAKNKATAHMVVMDCFHEAMFGMMGIPVGLAANARIN